MVREKYIEERISDWLVRRKGIGLWRKFPLMKWPNTSPTAYDYYSPPIQEWSRGMWADFFFVYLPTRIKYYWRHHA